MNSIKIHTSVFGGYFISAAPTTSGDSIWRKILDQKHNEYVWTSLSQFLFGGFFLFVGWFGVCLVGVLVLVFFWCFGSFYFSGFFFVCFWGREHLMSQAMAVTKPKQTNTTNHKITIQQLNRFWSYYTQHLGLPGDKTMPTQLEAEALMNTVFCHVSNKKIHHFLSYSKQAFKWGPKTNKIQALAYK